MDFGTPLSEEIRERFRSNLVPDERRADAYESVTNVFRVAIKGGIAAAFRRFSSGPSDTLTENAYTDAGFGEAVRTRPLDFCLHILPDNFLSPARFLAAALQPMLSGVRNSFLFVLGEPRPPLLATVELLGLEDVFFGSREELSSFLASLASLAHLGGCGRILSFAGPPEPSPSVNSCQSVTLLEERPPRLAVLDPECFDRDLLKTLHDPGNFADSGSASAFFASRETCLKRIREDGNAEALYLAPGAEGFWIHDELQRDLFRTKKRAFFSLDGEES
ncbi:MAG: hypothetical protein K5657_05635 [Desulfovibrio sp.]|nr:hypothetical protein [Desulfovibrio sp.]